MMRWKEMRKTVAFLFAVFLLLPGCTKHLGTMTALSTKEYEPSNINDGTLVKKDAIGESHCYIYFIVPTCDIMYPRIDDAVSEALSSSDGDFMKNVNIYFEYWFIPPFYAHHKIRVKGDAYKTSTAQ